MMKKENNNYIIYKAQNTDNGMTYIGATTYSVKQRKLDHVERANRGEENKFHVAISTYGADAFHWEQIDTASSIDELASKEKSYVVEYNSKEKGYNGDVGGGFKKSVYQYSITDGMLINTFDSLKNAGNVVNATKQDVSRACLSVNNVFRGYFWSYKFKEPFIPNNDLRKKEVFQFTVDGHFLAKYVSVSEASRITGLSKSCISRVCRGEREKSGGFLWKYV